jgi:cytochrome b561
MELFLKITLAVVMIMLLFRMWPAAKHWMENGPKGSGDDWRAALLAIGAVVGFVILLIMMVRS